MIEDDRNYQREPGSGKNAGSSLPRRKTLKERLEEKRAAKEGRHVHQSQSDRLIPEDINFSDLLSFFDNDVLGIPAPEVLPRGVEIDEIADIALWDTESVHFLEDSSEEIPEVQFELSEYDEQDFTLFDRYGNRLNSRNGKELILPIATGEVVNLALVQSGEEKFTNDETSWHNYFRQKQLEKSEAAELLQGFSFDISDPEFPNSPELSHLLSVMNYYGTLIDHGSFYELSPERKREISSDLSWRYQSYAPEVRDIATGIMRHLVLP
jgi:hypothetical protein